MSLLYRIRKTLFSLTRNHIFFYIAWNTIMFKCIHSTRMDTSSENWLLQHSVEFQFTFLVHAKSRLHSISWQRDKISDTYFFMSYMKYIYHRQQNKCCQKMCHIVRKIAINCSTEIWPQLSNIFDLPSYWQVNSLRPISRVASKWISKHLMSNIYFAGDGT